jgi:hypothetical protein
MAKPTKVAVVLTETGGSDTMVVSKALRGGRRVLSGPINRYDKIAQLTDVDLVTAAPAAGNPNLAAADLVTAAPAASKTSSPPPTSSPPLRPPATPTSPPPSTTPRISRSRDGMHMVVPLLAAKSVGTEFEFSIFC